MTETRLTIPLTQRLRTVADMINMGEKIAWGSETALMDEAAVAIEKKDKALLLAARWFKLCFDDETLNEHPPSKADLAGMFDAMQEARCEYSGAKINKE